MGQLDGSQACGGDRCEPSIPARRRGGPGWAVGQALQCCVFEHTLKGTGDKQSKVMPGSGRQAGGSLQGPSVQGLVRGCKVMWVPVATGGVGRGAGDVVKPVLQELEWHLDLGAGHGECPEVRQKHAAQMSLAPRPGEESYAEGGWAMPCDRLKRWGSGLLNKSQPLQHSSMIFLYQTRVRPLYPTRP